MLEMHGYTKGIGLGKRAEGIIEPVKAFKFTPGRGIDYINTAKVKQVYKQDADVGIQLRKAAEKIREAGACGDAEWNSAFKLANSIKVKEDGSVVKSAPGGRVTSWDAWKQARAEETRMDQAVEEYNSLAKGDKKKVKEKELTKEEIITQEVKEEAQSQSEP